MKRLTTILLTLLMALPLLYAQRPQRVQAIREPIVRELPNGDSLTIYLRGDERSHYTMTLDGWQIQEQNGWFYYVRLRHGQIVITHRKAHTREQRSRCEQRWLERKGIRKENRDE